MINKVSLPKINCELWKNDREKNGVIGIIHNRRERGRNNDMNPYSHTLISYLAVGTGLFKDSVERERKHGSLTLVGFTYIILWDITLTYIHFLEIYLNPNPIYLFLIPPLIAL